MRPYNYADSPDILTDGEWVQDGYTMRWVPADIIEATHYDGPLDKPACRDCGALPTESCVSPAGRPCKSHAIRVGKKACRCGAYLKANRKLCDDCLRESKVESVKRRDGKAA